jgi:hypothetical protein
MTEPITCHRSECPVTYDSARGHGRWTTTPYTHITVWYCALCTEVIDILDLERQAEQRLMDMRDQQVQDLLEQDKQEALARIRAQR